MKIKAKQLKESLAKAKTPKYVIKEGKNVNTFTERELSKFVDVLIEEYIKEEGGNPYEDLRFINEKCENTPLSEGHISTMKTLIWSDYKNKKALKKYMLENVYINKYDGLKRKSKSVLKNAKKYINEGLKKKKSFMEISKASKLPEKMLKEMVECNRENKKYKGLNRLLLNIVESYQAFTEKEMLELYDEISEVLPGDDLGVDPDDMEFDERGHGRYYQGEPDDHEGFNGDGFTGDEYTGSFDDLYSDEDSYIHDDEHDGIIDKETLYRLSRQDKSQTDPNLKMSKRTPAGAEFKKSSPDLPADEMQEDENTWMENSYLEDEISELERMLGEE